MTFDELPQRLGGDPIRPFMVAYGLGVDSTAMLVALARRYRAGAVECRPDAILFADVGDEKPPTYAYLPVMQEYLARVGFPQVHVVRYEPKFAKYHTLYENCIVNKTLPSLAFGYKKCSLKFKRQPQDKWTRHWDMAQLAWKAGLTVIKAIGYDAGPKDARRAHIQDDKQYHYWYPLAELGWVREQCMEEIRKEGLPVPVKSACFFCPSMKPDEVIELCREHPELGWKIIEMETNAAPNNTTIEGLWRCATRARPGSISEFIRQRGLLAGVGGREEHGVGDGSVDQPAHADRGDVPNTVPVGAVSVREAGSGNEEDRGGVEEGAPSLCHGCGCPD